MITPVLFALLATAQPQSQDPRVRDLVYEPGAVFQIAGRFRSATQIIFAPDEIVRHAAIGDSVSWEVAVEGSILFLKPRENQGATNLLVVTEKNGALRHYAFELTASGAGGGAYQVRFRYPQDERLAEAAVLADQRADAEERLIGLELGGGALDGPRNLRWTAQGDSALQPSEVTDNGRFTVLRFATGRAMPALFEVGEDGSERLVPYDVRGEWVVIHGVPRALRLRRGRSVLCLFNEAPPVSPVPFGTGTASPAVERTSAGGEP